MTNQWQPQPPQGYPQQPQQPQQPQGWPQQGQPLQPQQVITQQGGVHMPVPGGGYGPPGGGGGYGGAATMPGPAPHVVQMPTPPSSLPQTFLPDDATINEAFERARAEQEKLARQRAGGGSGKFKFWKQEVNGVSDFRKLPIGAEARDYVWICPSAAPKQGERPRMPYEEEASHFWKSARAPQGNSVPCLGDQCPICAARTAMFKMQDAAATEHAKNNGRSGKKAIYQLLILQNPQLHVHDDGVMRPVIWRANSTVHKDIVDAFQLRGIAACIDPQHGRPFLIRKKKTGPGDMDVETRIDVLDPSPVPQQFWNAFQNLHDLREILGSATAEEYAQAVTELRFPMTAEVQQLLSQLYSQQQLLAQQQPQQLPPQQSWSPSPNPPNPSPYAPQGAPAALMPVWQGQPPQQAPQEQQPQAPVSAPPPQQWAGQQGPPPQGPPQGYQQPQQPGPPQGYQGQPQQPQQPPQPQYPQQNPYSNVPPHLLNQMQGR